MISIYLLTNKENGKVYVGQTHKDLQTYARLQQSRARCGNAKPRLYAAIRKHGIENFEMRQLCLCANQMDADFVEILFIAALRSQVHEFGYNMADGGGGRSGLAPWNKDMKMSAAFSEAASVAQRKRFKTHKHPNKGRIMAAAQKEKISQTCKAVGIAPPVELRALAGRLGGAKAKGKPWSEARRKAYEAGMDN